MQIGQTVVKVKPAMVVLIGSIIVGIAGIVGAAIYVRAPQSSTGWAIPRAWEFATSGGANATLTMLSQSAHLNPMPEHNGYSQVDSDEGFEVNVYSVGPNADSVHIRNTIDFAVDSIAKQPADMLQFQFEATAPNPFPVIFTIRNSRVTAGQGVLWSHKYTVDGDWKTYTDTIPYASLRPEQSKFVELAGHLGSQPGLVRLRNIYLK